MKTSENINEIAAALSKAQGQMTGAIKGAANTFFKSKYSDLASIIEAISGPFKDNDLSFIQSPGISDGMVTVATRIMHNSGQWIEGEIQLPAGKPDAQGFGSSITYAKRYALQGMAGVPSVDDDGQAAVQFSKSSAMAEINRIMQARNKPIEPMLKWVGEELGAIYAELPAVPDKGIKLILGQLDGKR